jgi:long-chain acyl-CoA synthetase
MDPHTGEETIRAFLTEKEGLKIEPAEIMKICREELAPFKRPKDIIVLPELPKNALQKVLKKELRKL